MAAVETRTLNYSPEAIAEAAALIAAGQPVAIATETVYGLAADATNAQAVARIYEAKGRPSFNPLIVHVSSLEAATQLVALGPRSLELARQHWPGPLTIVAPLRPDSPIAASRHRRIYKPWRCAFPPTRQCARCSRQAAAPSPHPRPTPAARSARLTPNTSSAASAGESR